MARPNDDTVVNDDAGSHPLSRDNRKTRGRGRRRFGRGRMLRNGLGRGHHGLLGGGLLKHLSTLMTIIGLLKGLFGHKAHAGRGGAHAGAGRQRRPRKGKILRARAQKGIRRPPAVRQPLSPGGSRTGRVRWSAWVAPYVTKAGNIVRRRI